MKNFPIEYVNGIIKSEGQLIRLIATKQIDINRYERHSEECNCEMCLEYKRFKNYYFNIMKAFID